MNSRFESSPALKGTGFSPYVKDPIEKGAFAPAGMDLWAFADLIEAYLYLPRKTLTPALKTHFRNVLPSNPAAGSVSVFSSTR
jgi:hypothetical protein